MEKNNLLLFIFKLLILVNFLLFLVGCSVDATNDKISVKAKKDDLENKISEQLKQKLDYLQGTCPSGLHCGSPTCGLWSDFDNNDLCDRGV